MIVLILVFVTMVLATVKLDSLESTALVDLARMIVLDMETVFGRTVFAN